MGIGYLAAGAAVGAGKEYLKQGDEKRANNYQMIRDKRIAALRKENIGYEAGLRSDEAIRHEGYLSDEAETAAAARKKETDADRTSTETIASSKPITLGRGQQAYGQDGKLIASGPEYTHAPSASSSATDKFFLEAVEMRGAGGKSVGMRPRGELRADWYKEAYEELDNPEFPGMGLKIMRRNPDSKSWVEYHNSMVTDKYKLSPDDPNHMQGDPDALWDYAQRKFAGKLKTPEGRAAAIKRIQQANPGWEGPMDAGGNLDDPRTASPNPNEPSPGAGIGEGGYLDQGTQGTATSAADATQAAVTSQNAGVGSTGKDSPASPGEITTQGSTTFKVNENQIKKVEDMLKNPNWNTQDRKRLEEQLATLKAQAGQ